MQLLKTSRDLLLKPLTTVSGIVERRNTMPILANIYIEKENNNLSFIGSDSEVQISSFITLKDSESESIPNTATTVAARKVLEILRALPDSNDVKLNQEDNKLILVSGKSRFALQTMPAESFPKAEIPSQWDVEITTTQKSLKNMLNSVHFAMAHQDVRYYLNGMLFVVEPGVIRGVATDGHRLAHNAIDVPNATQNHDVIIPRKTIIELQRLLSENDDEIHIKCTKNQIKFTFNNIELISKLVDGKFPDFTRVIPSGYTRHLDINREKLLASLQRAAILTTEKIKGVRVQLSNNILKITSSNTEQEQAQEELEVEYSFEPLDMGFNVNYLIDVLSNLKNDVIRLSVQPDINSSTLISLSDDDNFKYVVMPMRI